eukprot:TRINITY_DN8936_c0_g1_i4.p1 TRINITY_DN8936_c0_g1~~TRINITY_DN8936_c0_g1_i4.p1  ORF type:complete len:616 (-),score=239.75 TRINITY_DN8936_c0_g1_i4:764-2590(-)
MEDGDFKHLVESTKALLLQTKQLVKLSKSPEGKNEAIMESARSAASLITGLEEIIKKMKASLGSTQKEMDRMEALEQSAQGVKETMLTMISMTKQRSAEQSEVEFEETFVMLCKQMAVHAKHMIEAGDSMKGSKKGILRPIFRRRTSSKSKADAPIQPIDRTTIGPAITRSLDIICDLCERSKEKGSDSEFRENINYLNLLMQNLQGISGEISLNNEWKRLEILFNTFIDHASATYKGEGDMMLDLDRSRADEALWWFLLLAEQKEKLQPLQAQLKEKEEALQVQATQLSLKEEKLSKEFTALAKMSSDMQDMVPSVPTTTGSFNLSMSPVPLGRSMSFGKRQFLVQLALPINHVIKTVLVEDEDMDAFIAKMFEKYYSRKLPKMVPTKFSLKVPGRPTFLHGKTQFVEHPHVKKLHESGKKIELLLVEKPDQREMMQIPDAMTKAEEKALVQVQANQKAPPSGYEGAVTGQLQKYEERGKAILAGMIIKYGIKPQEMKHLLSEEKYVPRLKELRTKFRRNSSEIKSTNSGKVEKMISPRSSLSDPLLGIAEKFDKIVEKTFDQYEGLRQIGDFRGIPEVGEIILQTGNNINTLFKKMMVSTQGQFSS